MDFDLYLTHVSTFQENCHIFFSFIYFFYICNCQLSKEILFKYIPIHIPTVNEIPDINDVKINVLYTSLEKKTPIYIPDIHVIIFWEKYIRYVCMYGFLQSNLSQHQRCSLGLESEKSSFFPQESQ